MFDADAPYFIQFGSFFCRSGIIILLITAITAITAQVGIQLEVMTVFGGMPAEVRRSK